MADINNIKPSSQPTVDTAKKVTLRENADANKSERVQTNEARPDTVSLTNAATDLQALRQTIADSSGVDQARVEALKSAVDSGSYQVDANVLAQNIVNFEQF